ncbi:hypothetical protein LMG31887_45980 (plasmid) [Xanthomonas hydrangeae]|nr:hypothetical protein LMG31887_45980 [Xanthomonas hydrangeae]CAD7747855.1 hypothetical protein LMG31887_45980 [Xanthomonas hydrangeae]
MSLRPTDARQNYAPVLDRIFQRSCRVLTVGRTAPSLPPLLLNRLSRRSRRVLPGVSNLTLPYSCQTAFPGAAAVPSPASAISPCPTPAKPLFPAQPPCPPRRQQSHPALLLPNRFSRRSRRVLPGVSNLTLPYSCQTAFPGAAAVSPRRQQSHPTLLLPNRFSRRSRRVLPGVSNLTLPYSCQTAFPGAAAVSSAAARRLLQTSPLRARSIRPLLTRLLAVMSRPRSDVLHAERLLGAKH